jgi:hypothetical protein
MKYPYLTLAAAGAAVALAHAVASADIVHVTITGTVEFNNFPGGTLAPARAGDPVVMQFDVDSTNYVDSQTYPTRGYIVNPATFRFQAGAGSMSLPNPLPGNTHAYFMLRNNDPVVDGFVFGSSVDEEVPLPVNIGGVSNINTRFLRTFTVGTVLPSLDILDAIGHWDSEYMSSFDWAVSLGGEDLMYVDYTSITIAGPCYANCDGSTTPPVLNVLDFTCFLQKFAAGDAYANCDASTTPPTLNVLDFTCFLQKFAAGCQ